MKLKDNYFNDNSPLSEAQKERRRFIANKHIFNVNCKHAREGDQWFSCYDCMYFSGNQCFCYNAAVGRQKNKEDEPKRKKATNGIREINL